MNNIKEKLINHYRTCSCDQYGQMSTIDIFRIIDGNNPQEVEELSSLVAISTYGDRYGTYKGINPWGAFKSEDIKTKCREAFAQNENRTRNLNSW
jgi:hypothetical protein